MVTARVGSPLHRREFRLYFVGNATSNIGNWISNVALAIYVHDITGSSFWVGLVGLGLSIPVLMFTLPAGVLADRYDRRRLLIGAQLVMAFFAAGLTIAVATGTANRYVAIVAAFGFGTGIAIAIPPLQALIPVLVPPSELGDALQLNALTFNLARVIGPLLAFAALATIGPSWAFGINTVSFFVLIWALSRIGDAPYPREADRPPGPIREAILYAWRHLRTRWLLLAIVAIGIALDPITTLSPALAVSYGLADDAAGWIVASWGGGAVLALLFGRRLINFVTEHGLGWIAMGVMALGLFALGASPSMVPAVASGLAVGSGNIVAAMAFTTTIQRDVPESLRGRVSALWTLAFLGPRAVISVLDGAAADAFGPRWTTAAFGLVALGAAVMLRRVQTTPGPATPPPA